MVRQKKMTKIRYNRAMSSRSPSLYRRLLPGLLFGVLVLIGLALIGDLRSVGQSLGRFDWRVFPLALLLTLFNYTLRFVKWQYYLRLLGVRGLPWRESLRIWVCGFPLAVTPAKAGEALKGVWLQQACGLPVGRGISAVVAERISDGLAVLALSTLGVFAYPRYWPAFALILSILLSLILISQIRPLALRLLNLGTHLPLIKRIVPGLREFYEGSFELFRPLPTLLGVGLGTLSWLGEGIGFYFILRGLGEPGSTALLGITIFTLSFSTVIGAASALPGGLGAAEASIAGMLTLLHNLTPATASAATLLIRLATLWFSVALGLIAWVLSPALLGIKETHNDMER